MSFCFLSLRLSPLFLSAMFLPPFHPASPHLVLITHLIAAGKPATLTLPEGLAAGAYLLRHEIISLSNASTEGGADFYASCAQIKVEHGGSDVPADADLASFPGAYSDTDKGILLDVSSLTLTRPLHLNSCWYSHDAKLLC